MKLQHFLLSFLLLAPALSTAQVLVKDHIFHPDQYNEDYYDVEPDFVYKSEFNIEPQHCINEYAARYQFEEMELKLPADHAEYQVMFFGHHDNGQYAVSVRYLDDGGADYVLHLYNNLDRCYSNVNLSDITNIFSRIAHFVYYRGYFYFNMEAPDGEVGDVEHTDFYYIYCFDPETETIRWQSEQETSRDEFLITDEYIFAGFGGSDCRDYVTLLKRENGQNLCEVPMPSRPTAIGMASDSIYFADYKGELYRYFVQPRGVLVTGKGVRLRRGPGTEHEIFADPYTGKTVYPLQDDILAYVGETDEWYKVHFMGEELYISKQFSEITTGRADDAIFDAYYQWNENALKNNNLYIYHPCIMLSMPLKNGDDVHFMKSGSKLALFEEKTNSKLKFVAEGDFYSFYLNQEQNYVRYYEGNAIGFEDSRLYIIKNGKIAETWLYSNTPVGDWHQDEVEIKNSCSKIINGKTMPCTEKEFFQKIESMDNSTETMVSTLFEDIDI